MSAEQGAEVISLLQRMAFLEQVLAIGIGLVIAAQVWRLVLMAKNSKTFF